MKIECEFHFEQHHRLVIHDSNYRILSLLLGHQRGLVVAVDLLGTVQPSVFL